TPENFPAQGWGTSAGWADIDRDGLADLYLGHYLDWDPSRELVCRDSFGNRDVCGPAQYPGAVGKFLHNEGDGSFSDWSERVGLVGGVKGLGVVACDFDQDGWIDFYAANDETPNQLYLGRPDGTFLEVGKASGVAWNEYGVEEGSMGLGVDDFDGDGLFDIFVTNFENEDNALYRNLGDGQFKHVSVAVGVSGHSRMMVGFGTIMLDFDGDTWPDLFVCNGNAVYSMGQGPYQQPPQLFRNVAGKRFENVSSQGGVYFRTSHVARGIAAGDLDGDGGIDVVVTHQNEPAAVLRNRLAPASFVKLRLRATAGEPQAAGSRVTLRGENRLVVRCVVPGVGYLSQSDYALILPLSTGQTTTDVSVEWLGRRIEWFRGLPTGRTHELVEGRGSDD
ncbi:MAG: CRTAC1 family protein, partial [Planctomycetaceae bacterium]